MSDPTFDELMAATNPAMAIVTAMVDGERAGCLVGFSGQSSIEPPRFCVWISKQNHTYAVAQRAVDLAVHLLTKDDHELARTFGELTGDTTDKFALVDHRDGPTGVPILSACDHGLVGRIVGQADHGGDHVLFDLEAVETWSDGPFTPLRLSDVEDLHAGHDPD